MPVGSVFRPKPGIAAPPVITPPGTVLDLIPEVESTLDLTAEFYSDVIYPGAGDVATAYGAGFYGAGVYGGGVGAGEETFPDTDLYPSYADYYAYVLFPSEDTYPSTTTFPSSVQTPFLVPEEPNVLVLTAEA